MSRLSPKLWALGLSLCACAAPPEPMPALAKSFVDQTPSFVTPGALDAVIPVYHAASETLASGTVIAPDLVLTAAHVVQGLQADDRGALELWVDGRRVRGTVAALGDQEAPHGDWALLRVEPGRFLQPAVLHPPARRPGWCPEPGTEVLLVGYAAGFFPDMRIDADAPTPCVRAVIEEATADGDCWYAAGDELELGGMSGGGVMIWNHEQQRPELIGVFRGYVGKTVTRTEVFRVAGFSLPGRERRRRGISFMIHRLPEALLRPGAAAR